mmetsp:Transcript_53777/g.128134  ORF Transcript_53777/g.128134 Transcript_53777/m.128134 type:complete len:315 (+) Transcript_53777:90-1034(+)
MARCNSGRLFQRRNQRLSVSVIPAVAFIVYSSFQGAVQAWVQGHAGSPTSQRPALGREIYVARRSEASASEGAETFADKKEALKKCLAREYTSFFRPFEQAFYTEGVTFKDPLNQLEGKDKYRMNVEMLSGENLVGTFLFKDGFINLHSVEDIPGDEYALRTRWTLGFTFKLLPWQPEAVFTGVSEYTIDADAKVVSQRDYWDTLSLDRGGEYRPEEGLAGLVDLNAQLLLPKTDGKPTGWELLRRTYNYEVYRVSSTGKVFAVSAKKNQLDQRAIASAIERHGLKAGSPCSQDGYAAVEVESPHPWEGSLPDF